MKSISLIPWRELSASQKAERIRSLEVLRKMRSGDSLTSSSKEIGLSLSSSKSNLGRSIFKRSMRWKARKSDSIQRAMQIYEKGRVRSVIIRNSKDSSLIGEYYNAVRKYLETGDASYLKKFRRKTIIDSKGKKHKLETNPKKIREIEEAKESSEFFDIYSDE